jgi:hypothetical protein
MNWKKILGGIGAVGSVAATILGAVDPSQLPTKYALPLTILGTLLAYFGKHPLSKTP